MPKKKNKIMLHMHQIREFIENRHDFYNSYFKGIQPDYYNYRGVDNAFLMGSALDYAIKRYYLNLNEGKENLAEGCLDSQELRQIEKPIDKFIIQGLLGGYINRYHSNPDTKEYFHDFQVSNFKIIFIPKRGKERFLKNEYILYLSPDLLGQTLLYNDLIIFEIKSSGVNDTQETLDFQTMMYCYGSYKWDFRVPKGVIKRTIFKPQSFRVKQRKDETDSEFRMRLIKEEFTAKSDRYFKSNYREVDLDMIKEFELYLNEIMIDLDSCLNSKNKYKFYRQSDQYWGL